MVQQEAVNFPSSDIWVRVPVGPLHAPLVQWTRRGATDSETEVRFLGGVPHLTGPMEKAPGSEPARVQVRVLGEVLRDYENCPEFRASFGGPAGLGAGL